MRDGRNPTVLYCPPYQAAWIPANPPQIKNCSFTPQDYFYRLCIIVALKVRSGISDAGYCLGSLSHSARFRGERDPLSNSEAVRLQEPVGIENPLCQMKPLSLFAVFFTLFLLHHLNCTAMHHFFSFNCCAMG